jgi:hypothetical protein
LASGVKCASSVPANASTMTSEPFEPSGLSSFVPAQLPLPSSEKCGLTQ